MAEDRRDRRGGRSSSWWLAAWSLVVSAFLLANVSCSTDSVDASASSGGTGGIGTGGHANGGTGGTIVDSSLPTCEGGSGGAIEYHSCNCASAGGFCNAAGGAIGYQGCPSFLASGIQNISCTLDGAPASPSALAGFCAHMSEVPGIFDQTIMFDCGVGRYGKTVLYRPDGAVADVVRGGVGGGFVTFDEQQICAPELRAKLVDCTSRILPCPRPPICTPSGPWGCDDIVAACPTLTMTDCRRGFDSRSHEGRIRIHDCLASDAGDCVAAFYRCAWGI